MANYKKVRFVGGSMHNQLLECNLDLRYIRIPIKHEPKIQYFSDSTVPVFRTNRKFESYTLHCFMTAKFGTLYFQYVLDSIKPGLLEVYYESFNNVKEFNLNVKTNRNTRN